MFFARSRKSKLDDSQYKTTLMSNDDDLDILISENQTKNQPSSSFPPKVWLALGITYVCLGIIQLILAAMWHAWFGVVIGASVAKLGTSLFGIGYTGLKPLPPPNSSSIMDRIQRFVSSLVFWGSSQVQRLLFLLRWPIIAYGVYVALLIAVHVSSPDPKITSFPTSCPVWNRFGCSRIAETSSQSARGLSPLHIKAPMNVTHAAVIEWIGSRGRSAVLVDKPNFIHARVLSLVFNFADDFMVHLKCSKEGRTVVEVQGQLRLGQSDMGVNARRNQMFFSELEKRMAREEVASYLQGGGGGLCFRV